MFAWVMAWLMGTSGAESLNVAASLFLGQTEAPLTIRPYLSQLDQLGIADGDDRGHGARLGRDHGGLFRLWRRAPARPRRGDHDGSRGHFAFQAVTAGDGIPETLGHVPTLDERADANILDAAARGTRDGLHLALNIAAMLIAFLGLIALVNLGLGRLGTSLQAIFGWICLAGCLHAGSALGRLPRRGRPLGNPHGAQRADRISRSWASCTTI